MEKRNEGRTNREIRVRPKRKNMGNKDTNGLVE